MACNIFLDSMNEFSEKQLGLKFADRNIFGMTVLDFEVPEKEEIIVQDCVEKYRLCYHYIAFNNYLEIKSLKPKIIPKIIPKEYIPVCYHYLAFVQNEYDVVCQKRIDKNVFKKLHYKFYRISSHYIAWRKHFGSSMGIVFDKFICPKITSLWLVNLHKCIKISKTNKRNTIPVISETYKKKYLKFLIDPPDKLVDNYITVEIDFHEEDF